jgi:hypothetical protein
MMQIVVPNVFGVVKLIEPGMLRGFVRAGRR